MRSKHICVSEVLSHYWPVVTAFTNCCKVSNSRFSIRSLSWISYDFLQQDCPIQQ